MNGYGNDMSPYRAAGELAGITRLVDDFYSNMDTFPEARGGNKGVGNLFCNRTRRKLKRTRRFS